MTQIDYEREMAVVAVIAEPDAPAIVGEIRASPDPGGTSAEFAIVVRSDVQRLGLGRKLLQKLIDYSRARGLHRLYGLVAATNRRMLGLARTLGFDVDVVPGAATAVITLDLDGR
jgi:acetyltransferase